MKQPEARREFHIAGTSFGAPKLSAGLYLVATPIGNLRDITLRALETLAAADLIACEDTRVTRKLLDHYGIADAAHALSRAQRASRAAEAAGAARRRRSGRAGLGCRHAADFRSRLQARARGARGGSCASPRCPGASAVLTALTVSGLPTDRFFFEGFLPPKATQRRARIAELARIPATWCCSKAARASPTRSPISPRLSARARPRSAAS